jgi:hypothetical protein
MISDADEIHCFLLPLFQQLKFPRNVPQPPHLSSRKKETAAGILLLTKLGTGTMNPNVVTGTESEYKMIFSGGSTLAHQPVKIPISWILISNLVQITNGPKNNTAAKFKNTESMYFEY